MSFTNRKITVHFDLAKGNFEGGGNKATLSGLRISAHIRMPGGQDSGQLQMTIFGMTLSMMNQLSTLGRNRNFINKNQITVQAGDDINGMSTVFIGDISYAWVDAKSQPNVCFRLNAQPAGYQRVRSVPPTSVQGAGDVATIMGQIAKTMGLSFENNGVSIKLSNPYLPGSPLKQAMALAKHAGIEHVIDKGTLAIWKPGTARKGNATIASPQTGMVGYPMFVEGGVMVEMLFQPNTQYGGKLTVKSDLTAACGDWAIRLVEYELESEIPHGKWFMTVFADGIGNYPVP